MLPLQEAVSQCMHFYADQILSDEAKKDAFSRFGYQIYNLAKERYIFDHQEHIIPDKYKEDVEKEANRRAGIATSKTLLTW